MFERVWTRTLHGDFLMQAIWKSQRFFQNLKNLRDGDVKKVTNHAFHSSKTRSSKLESNFRTNDSREAIRLVKVTLHLLQRYPIATNSTFNWNVFPLVLPNLIPLRTHEQVSRNQIKTTFETFHIRKPFRVDKKTRKLQCWGGQAGVWFSKRDKPVSKVRFVIEIANRILQKAIRRPSISIRTSTSIRRLEMFSSGLTNWRSLNPRSFYVDCKSASTGWKLLLQTFLG